MSSKHKSKKKKGKMNLVSLLAKIKRDNTGLSFYEDNPELFDRLGEEGVKIVETGNDEGNFLSSILNLINPFQLPKEERQRMSAYGNKIFVPTGEFDKEHLIKSIMTRNVPYEGLGELAVFEELPHVQQFRDEGFLGMAAGGTKDIWTRALRNIFDKEGVIEEYGEDAYTGLNPTELQKTLYDTHGSHEEFHGDESMKRDLINELLGEGSYMKYRGWPYVSDEGGPMQYHVDGSLNLSSEITPYPGFTYQGEELIPEISSFKGRQGTTRLDDNKALISQLGLSKDQWEEMYPGLWNEGQTVGYEHSHHNNPPSSSDEMSWESEMRNPVEKDVNMDGAINLLDALSLISNQSRYGEDYEHSDVDRIKYQSLYE